MSWKRRSRLSASAALLAVAAAAAWWVWPRPPHNVVFIIVDTLRADHLGLYGYERDTSPRLERTLHHGAVFRQAYSHAPWTAPSVTSLLSSLPVRDHGVTTWNQPVPEDLLMMAEVFQTHGYQTSAVVSHSVLKPKFGFHQGFDHYDISAMKLGAPSKTISSQHVTDRALRQLDDLDEPFLLMLHYFDPHNTYMPQPDHDFGERQMDRYDGEVGYTDHHVGRFLKALAQEGHKEDTLVVFVADHGEEFGDHGGTRHTNTLFNEVVRVPLVFRGPGIERQTVDAPVAGIDVAPTVLNFVGLPIPDEFTGEAIELTGTIQPRPDRPVFMETRRVSDLRGVVQGHHKLIRNEANGSTVLYDLDADPQEAKPIQNAEVHDRLLELLDQHYAEPGRVAPTHELNPDDLKALQELGYLE